MRRVQASSGSAPSGGDQGSGVHAGFAEGDRYAGSMVLLRGVETEWMQMREGQQMNGRRYKSVRLKKTAFDRRFRHPMAEFDLPGILRAIDIRFGPNAEKPGKKCEQNQFADNVNASEYATNL